MIVKKTAVLLFCVGLVAAFVSCRASQGATLEETQHAEHAEQHAHSPAGERLEQIRASLLEVTTTLNEEGEYNCCVAPRCSWCALHEGECECFDNLQHGEEVCPGCGLGWHNGNGIVDGVDASDVKWTISHSHGGEHGPDEDGSEEHDEQ